MLVRFDSLNRFETPQIYLCNPGSRYQDGKLTGMVGILTDTDDEEAVLNFNAASEFNFRITEPPKDIWPPEQDDQEAKENRAHLRAMFRAVQNRRMLFVDGLGYFIITKCDTGYGDDGWYKDVKAQSCEVELQNKNAPFVDDGTYRFLDGTIEKDGEVVTVDGLFNKIMAVLPLWSIGTVDEAVAARYRTFKDVNTDLNCLGFMLENMQDAYECIFLFDGINRVVSVYDQNNYVRETSIHLSEDELAETIEIEENADDLYTALSVLGDNDLNIAAVNPIGTGTIYLFDNYIPWMSDELQERVRSWEAEITANEGTGEGSYYQLNLAYYQLLDRRNNLEMEMDKLNTQITMYSRCRENIVAEASTDSVDEYNQVIIQNGGEPISQQDDVGATIAIIDDLISQANNEYTLTREERDTVASQLVSLEDQIRSIRDRLRLDRYFTDNVNTTVVVDGQEQVVTTQDTSLLDELQNYIYEGAYQDQYIGITDIMDYKERFEQMKTLYDRARAQLVKASVPNQQFNLDVENFIFEKAFSHYTEQLETGCLVGVGMENGETAKVFLTAITVNFADTSLSLTFGNRFNRFDPRALFDDVLGSVKRSANTLNYVKDVLYPIKNGEINAMKAALENSRNIAKNAALSSSNEEVVIDDTGYTGRRLNASGEYDPHQIKINGMNIVFTDNAWDTCSTAIGLIPLGNGEYTYGVNAQTVIGELLVGGGLRIIDQNGNDLLVALGDIQTSVDNMRGQLTQVTQDASSVSIRVSSLEDSQGEADHVRTKTNEYTFDDSGLHIRKSDEEIENKIDNTGMYVNRVTGEETEEMLTANKDGVNAINITVRQYLVVGDNARFESYNDGTGERRTACFFIGG